MTTKIHVRLGIAMALLLATMSAFAPAAPAVLDQGHLQAAPVKVEQTTAFKARADGPDGYQPQLGTAIKEDPLLGRGFEESPASSPKALIRVDGPDGSQPQLKGYQPVVLASPDDGVDWVAGGSGLGIGLALSLLFAAAWTVSRRSRLVHS
jgi:hypothetical protein